MGDDHGDILIVDDTPENLKVLGGMLKDEGYKVRPVPNGRIALRAVEQSIPDLILLDINMPEMDGYETCQRLKADERFADIPIIFLSALTDTADKIKAFEAGGADYVEKPFRFEEVKARVRVHLELLGLRRELEGKNEELEARVQKRTAQLAALSQAYERYVPKEFLRCLGKESILHVALGDQIQREMTILFTDIRDFTALSERMTPQESFDFLNEYLGRVSPLIRQHSGFVDKYIGDAVMALFPSRADDAIRSAIAMAHEVRELGDELERSGRPRVRTGTGLHTGSLMLGVIGADERFDATVIADAVNLASRIDALTKLYQADILVSQETLDALENPGEYDHRFLGMVQVTGRETPLRVYEFFEADRDEVRELKLQAREVFRGVRGWARLILRQTLRRCVHEVQRGSGGQPQ